MVLLLTLKQLRNALFRYVPDTGLGPLFNCYSYVTESNGQSRDQEQLGVLVKEQQRGRESHLERLESYRIARCKSLQDRYRFRRLNRKRI
jgi:hypothetical protein